MKGLKKLTTTLVAMTLLLTGCQGKTEEQTQTQTETTELTEMVNAYVSKNAESYAFEVAKTLAYDADLLSNELGYRTAGSEAEHKAADWIASQMEAIGLEEVEKIGVTVDLFEFKDASLTIEGTDIDIMPASYQVNGTDEKGITAQIVDVGTGTFYDYYDVDVEGKIVLVGVDQWNECWISGYMAEAYYQGASAVVSYDVGGYGTYSDDVINVQDVCQDDLLPTVAISYNQYLEIAQAIQEGHDMATLVVEAKMEPEAGTSYNVAGRIKGQSSDQQIIISGHYDVYFNGFQDDSCAIGVILGIAKTMKEAGIQPQNDIVFVAHGSEEWGATGTEFDWTTGAWELINNVKPEWATSTIAMINFELPAFYDGATTTQISCVPEYANVVEKLVNTSGLLPDVVNGVYPAGYDCISVDTNTMEDGISYRGAGVPYFVNMPGTADGPEGWIQQRYHTQADDVDTYNKDVMATNINTYGILALYLDSMPAMSLDFTATCDDLLEARDEDLFDIAGVDIQAYDDALNNLREAAEGYNEKINALNTGTDANRYEQGKALNAKTREAFKAVQDGLIGIIGSSSVVIKHEGYAENLGILAIILDTLPEGELSNEEGLGMLDVAWALNGGREYLTYLFSQEVVESAIETNTGEANKDNLFWDTNKGYKDTDTYLATMSVFDKAMTEEENPDFEDEITLYEYAFMEQLDLFKQTVENEIEAMNKIAEILKK